MEYLRHGVLVVGVVVVVGAANVLVVALEFHEYQRDAIHKPNQVAPAAMQRAVYPQLLSSYEAVHFWVIEVEYLGEFSAWCAVRIEFPYGNAVAQHFVLGLVGLQQGIAYERLRKRFDRLSSIGFVHPLVKFEQGIFKVAFEQHVAVALAPERARTPQLFLVEAVMNFPSHARQKLACGLLHGFFL